MPPRYYLLRGADTVLSGVGCSLLKRGKEPVSTQPIPLTPVIWFSPSVTTAEVPYHDGCGEVEILVPDGCACHLRSEEVDGSLYWCRGPEPGG